MTLTGIFFAALGIAAAVYIPVLLGMIFWRRDK